MVDTIEELNECRARGEAAVKKPHFNILPEILCGLFVKHFDDDPVPRLMENHEIQTPPPHLVQRFRQNELESQTKKIKRLIICYNANERTMLFKILCRVEFFLPKPIFSMHFLPNMNKFSL